MGYYNPSFYSFSNNPDEQKTKDKRQKTKDKYITGISDDASLHQRRLYKKYDENLLNVSKRTDLDIKPGSQNNKCLHSSTKLEMTLLLPTFRNNKGIERLNGLERYFYAATTDTLSSNGNNKTISVSHL
jgi:hypothetical protein